MKVYYSLIFILFTPCFVFSQVSSIRKDLLNEHIQLGKEFFNNGDYSSALMEFNLAFGYLKRNSKHVLRDEIAGLILESKERIIRSKKRSQNIPTVGSEENLLPLDEEPNDFTVTETKGKIIARNIWAYRESLSSKESLGVGRLVAVLPDGALEIKENASENFFLRASGNSAFGLEGTNTISLHSGDYCIFTEQNHCNLRILLSGLEIQVSSDKPYAFIIGVSNSQDSLISCILGRIKIYDHSNNKSLNPGNAIVVNSNGSMHGEGFELSSSLIQKKLLCGLSSKPVFYPTFLKQASAQAKYLQSR
jgi:hypothetical protein